LQSLNRQNELAREAYQAQHGTDDTRLGATLKNLTSADKEKLNVDAGVKVTELFNGKLKNAGIKEGFVITHIDNDPVRNVDEFNDIIENKRGGVLIEGVYPGGVRAYYGFGL
jgi:S1-C subfamily serine protease